jgi:protein CpxP
MIRQPANQTLFHRRLSLVAAGLLLSATAAAGPHGPGLFGGQRTEARLDRMTEQLALTDSQRDEIGAILEQQRAEAMSRRQETRALIDAVLTDEQRADRDNRRARRLDRRLERMTARLELTEAQQQEIRAIWDDAQSGTALLPGDLRERVDAVLTDEQREELAARRGSRGHRSGCGERRRGQVGVRGNT